jgi:hypothetical protein
MGPVSRVQRPQSAEGAKEWGRRRTLWSESDFCRWRLMRWCDKHDVGYIIGLARNAVLKRLACPWMEVSAAQFALTHEKQRLFGEFVYGAETWDRERRVIVKAEHLDEGPNTRFVVTNLVGTPQTLEGVLEVLFDAPVGQSATHEIDHSNQDHRFAVFRQELIVSVQPPVPIQPRESPFHNPSFRQHHKASQVI